MQTNPQFIYHNYPTSKQLFTTPILHSNYRLLLFIAFVFSYIVEINSYILPSFLESQLFSINYLDYVEIMENFIYIISGLVLLQLINFIDNKKIIIFSLGSFLFITINIFTLDIHRLLKIYLLLVSATKFLVISSIFIQILSFTTNYLVIIGFFISCLFGFLCGELTMNYLPQYGIAIDKIISLILTTIIFISSFLIQSSFKHSPNYIFNFSKLIKRTEPELISGFMISYIFNSIYWQYDVWVVTKHLLIKDIQEIWFYMAASAIVLTPIILFTLMKYNKYIINLSYAVLLLIVYIYFLSFPDNLIVVKLISAILGSILYAILLSNIKIFTDYFQGFELKTIVILYFTIFALGGYVGIISAESLLDNPSKLAAFIPPYVVVVIYLIYYMYYVYSKKPALLTKYR